MERTYTILLDRGGTFATRRRGGTAFEQPIESASRLLAEPPRPVVHREKLTAQELQELAQEPDFVAAAEIMHTRLLAPLPDDELERGVTSAGGRRRQSWGIGAVGADHSKYSGADVTVAVLDTGIDAGHAAFRGAGLVEKDFTGLGNGDTDGHGTHCAGILFGRNVDGVRIGVAPGVRRALIGKILGPAGGNSDMLVRAIAWAHEQGARVIAMSVGFDFAATVARRIEEGWVGEMATAVALEAYRANLRLLDRLLRMLRMQEPFTGGAIMVAAAGNDSSRGLDGEFVMTACPPCGSDKIVAVGAFDPSAAGAGCRISRFSNCGVEIVAPGAAIVSAAAGGGLKALSGTSVAAPHVAGVAALWWQAVKQSELPANATLVRGKLLASAESRGFSPSVYPGERGAGRALAPRDGMSVTPAKSAPRLEAAERFGRGDVVWAAGGIQRAIGGDFEPISTDVGGVHSGWPGGGRLC
jgi:subtilisin family serine protease